MLYLLLKVASAVGMGLVLKHADTRGLPRLPLIRLNYAAAAMLAFLGCILTSQQSISRPTALLAIGTGILFVGGILAWTQAIRAAGLALSVVAMRTAVVIPLAASVLIWHERPAAPELAGAAVALTALGLVLWDAVRRQPSANDQQLPTAGPGCAIRHSSFVTRYSRSGAMWLAALFVVDGLVMVPARAFRQYLPAQENLPFQTVIFITGFFITTILYYVRKPRTSPDALKFGALLGAANLGNYLFLVMALAVLPGVVVYPVIAAGEVGLAAVAGIVVWKERIGWKSWLGISLAVASLVLIQLGRAAG